MASEWPFGYEPREQFRVWAGHHEPEHDSGRGKDEPYVHRDAARAWQAFRDWLDGTPEQWARAVSMAWQAGRDQGIRAGRILR